MRAYSSFQFREAETFQGQKVMIDASEGVKINDSQATQADVEVSNGVIHIIDTVILPQ